MFRISSRSSIFFLFDLFLYSGHLVTIRFLTKQVRPFFFALLNIPSSDWNFKDFNFDLHELTLMRRFVRLRSVNMLSYFCHNLYWNVWQSWSSDSIPTNVDASSGITFLTTAGILIALVLLEDTSIALMEFLDSIHLHINIYNMRIKVQKWPMQVCNPFPIRTCFLNSCVMMRRVTEA